MSLEIYLLDWANLLLRWVHVITGIAWIGASFYFVWLDNSLEKPTDEELRKRGVDGELWAVHGGGFYNPQKYMVAPRFMPQKLHWFYWESYSTWLTGFALFTVIYLFNARSFLIDPRVFAWSPAAAISAALAYLVAGWVFYNLICRVLGQGPGADRRVGLLVAGYVALAAWLACQFFAGRAAFLLTGAMMATIMSANVLMVIIPGQRKVMAQMKAGEPVDPVHGQRAKQRSVHNTYFTLPVVFAMLAPHYPLVYQARHNWLVLLLIMLAGVLIRQFFLLRHKGRIDWRWWLAGAAVLVALIVTMAPTAPTPVTKPVTTPAAPPHAGPQTSPQAGAQGVPPTVASKGAAAVPFSEVRAILDARCALCHNAGIAQKGVRVDEVGEIARQAQSIYQQVVANRLMPLGNVTQMTEDERARIAAWFNSGAATE